MATIPMETENQHDLPDQVTVLIPHFQTLEAIRLCLRSIRYYTPQCLKVRVLDNGSKDNSIDYLRSVKWIELVPTGIPNDTWTAHFQALNRAVADVQTPFFLIMHSDTFVCNHRWLDFLMDRLNARGYAAVGSRSQCVIRCHFRWLRQMFTPTRRRELKPGVPRLRSLCALYRTRVFRQLGCRFFCDETNREDITGLSNEMLVRAGHHILAMPGIVLCPYIFHAGDTTRILNRTFDKKTKKHAHSPKAFFSLPSTCRILADDRLDEPWKR
jgi:hypothetical protein